MVSLWQLIVSLWHLYGRAAQAQPLLMDCLNSLVLWTAGDCAVQCMEKQGFKLRRMLSTSIYGCFVIAPFGHYWQTAQNQRRFAGTSMEGVVAFYGEVFLDLSMFGSIHVLGFFTFLTLAEGGSWQDVAHKVRADFWATYAAECAFWAGFQAFNFAMVPVLYQLLAVNVATIFDSTFLCWARSQADWAAGIKRWLGAPQGGPSAADLAAGVGSKRERLISSEPLLELEDQPQENPPLKC